MDIQSLNEREFCRKALLSSPPARLDCRQPLQHRPLSITRGNHAGQAMVRLGDTKVFCSVSASLQVPSPDRPFEGTLSVFAEVFAGAYPPDFSATELDSKRLGLQRLLDRSIKVAKVVDCESLCVATAKQVWAVRVDVHVLDDDGAVGDAALIAAVTALQSFRRPAVEVQDGRVVVFDASDRHPEPLTIMHTPAPVTFAFLAHQGPGDDRSAMTDQGESAEQRTLVILDPSAQEEMALDGCMTLVMNRQGELVTAVKAGGLPLPSSIVTDSCLPLAKERSLQVLNAISESLK